jgi:hypothetical protein
MKKPRRGAGYLIGALIIDVQSCRVRRLLEEWNSQRSVFNLNIKAQMFFFVQNSKLSKIPTSKDGFSYCNRKKLSLADVEGMLEDLGP